MAEPARKEVEGVDNRPPIVVLRDKLVSRQSELRAALVDTTVESFVRAVMTSVALNTELLGCSWQSIWNACLRACRDGLLPDGVDGALVPYKGNVTWIPMYQGLLRRFRRSGQFKWVTANIVRTGELFEHFIDQDGEHFKHVPGFNTAAAITCVYAVATTKDGGIFLAVLPIDEANKIRTMSKAGREDSPWKMWPEEMYKKTALRRLSKVLPSARDLDVEEPPEIEQTATMIGSDADLPRITKDAPSSPQAALDQFASGESVDQTTGEISDAKPAPAPTDDPVAAAHSLGKDARAGGMARRAIPGEYRQPDRQREAEAWLSGWDGGPIPRGDPKQPDMGL